jgi:hypothetical protein
VDRLPLRTNVAVAVAKLGVMPLVGLVTTLALKRTPLLSTAPHDAFFLVAMVVTLSLSLTLALTLTLTLSPDPDP